MPSRPTLAAGESARLRRKIELLLPALVDAGRRLTSHPRAAELYPEYLFTTHCVIRASVPLMEAALERARELEGGDPVAAALASYLEQHIEEELHHDDWLLDDLEVVGVSRASLLSRPPPPAVARLVGAQYYWIFHYHPVALLGYIAVLEGYPPSPSLIDEFVAATGYPRDAFRTLAAHGELDPHHREELDEALDALPLTSDQSTLLGLSALSTVDGLARAIDDLVEDAE